MAGDGRSWLGNRDGGSRTGTGFVTTFVTGGRGLGVLTLTVVTVVFLGLPLIALVVRTVEEVRDRGEVASSTWTILRQALILSLWSSLVAVVLIVLFGTPLAYVLARRRFRGAALIDTLVDLPMILPPAVAGLALLMAFGRRGLLGAELDALGLTLAFSTGAVIVAQVFVACPFYVRSARAGFARVDPDLERAAADLGAPPWRVFVRITLPLVRPSLLAGGILAWARALGEFGATIMFAGNFPGTTQTMPLAIYQRYEAGDLTTALFLAVVLLASSFAVLLVVRLGPGRGSAVGPGA